MVAKRGGPTISIFVEGGGDTAALKAACRQGFAALLERAGLAGRMPTVIACGGRDTAFKRYAAAAAAAGPGEVVLLLVDAEAPVAHTSPWDHLKHRGDPWKRPVAAGDEDCHLMTQCMETWLLADRAALKAYFGQGFLEAALPSRANLEDVSKIELFASLKKATAACQPKGEYNKAAHSFALLALIDPSKVRELQWAGRFFGRLDVLTATE